MKPRHEPSRPLQHDLGGGDVESATASELLDRTMPPIGGYRADAEMSTGKIRRYPLRFPGTTTTEQHRV